LWVRLVEVFVLEGSRVVGFRVDFVWFDASVLQFLEQVVEVVRVWISVNSAVLARLVVDAGPDDHVPFASGQTLTDHKGQLALEGLNQHGQSNPALVVVRQISSALVASVPS